MIHQPLYRSSERRTSDITHDERQGADDRYCDHPQHANSSPSADTLLFGSNVQITGLINDTLFGNFMKQLGDVRAGSDDLVVEIMTQGGDADTARRMALELRLFRSHSGRAAYCVGKTAIFSAGVTIFAAFERKNRFLTPDATLLVHERHVDKTVVLQGPIKSAQQIVREELAALETAERVEREDFERFVEGSKMSVDDLTERARHNCYLTAMEAFDLQLIGAVVQ